MDTFKSGDWNAICDSCGFKFKASKLRKRWDGFMVCPADWNIRHPLDMAKAPAPQEPVPWTRPEPANTFVTVDYISESIGLQETTIPSGHNDGDL